MDKLSEQSKPVTWPNGCNETAVEALRYLAEKPRPCYGNSTFNTEHLYMIAREVERMASQPLYSQEYVSALQHESAVNWEAATSLVAENEELKRALGEKDKRIAELESGEIKPEGLKLMIEAIGAHGYIVGCLVQGRQDLALEESRKWAEAFSQAAEQSNG